MSQMHRPYGCHGDDFRFTAIWLPNSPVFPSDGTLVFDQWAMHRGYSASRTDNRMRCIAACCVYPSDASPLRVPR